jgi:hypothetical protein
MPSPYHIHQNLQNRISGRAYWIGWALNLPRRKQRRCPLRLAARSPLPPLRPSQPLVPQPPNRLQCFKTRLPSSPSSGQRPSSRLRVLRGSHSRALRVRSPHLLHQMGFSVVLVEDSASIRTGQTRTLPRRQTNRTAAVFSVVALRSQTSPK